MKWFIIFVVVAVIVIGYMVFLHSVKISEQEERMSGFLKEDYPENWGDGQ